MPSEATMKEARDVRVLVLSGYGLNCEAETAEGFLRAGAMVDTIHLGDVLERGGAAALAGYDILAFVGGFSFGDHIQSGRVYANRLRFRLGEALGRFVGNGGLALGICNGFQTLVCLGLLPALGKPEGAALPPQTAALVHNDRLGYFDTWVRLAVDAESPCLWTRGLGPSLEMPSRHGEGKLLFRDDALRADVEARHLVPVRYADAGGGPTEVWPDNPNGSPAGAAGLCDPTGRIFGLMPHPDAYLYPENHPDWIRQRDAGRLPDAGLGLRIFENGVRAVVGA
jgi:phosphoribosylformylglycinamidine synthase subunit PurQ / glutaminase